MLFIGMPVPKYKRRGIPMSAPKYESLAMLYLQNQDISDLSPEELLDKYEEVYQKICKHRSANYGVKNNSVSGSI